MTRIDVWPANLVKGPAKSMARDWLASTGSGRVRDRPLGRVVGSLLISHLSQNRQYRTKSWRICGHQKKQAT